MKIENPQKIPYSVLLLVTNSVKFCVSHSVVKLTRLVTPSARHNLLQGKLAAVRGSMAPAVIVFTVGRPWGSERGRQRPVNLYRPHPPLATSVAA